MTNRRNFLKSAATVAGLTRFGAMNAFAQAADYKALVCIFMFGGNDGNNVVVPQTQTEYNNYKAARGSLARARRPLASAASRSASVGSLMDLSPARQQKGAIVADEGEGRRGARGSRLVGEVHGDRRAHAGARRDGG